MMLIQHKIKGYVYRVTLYSHIQTHDIAPVSVIEALKADIVSWSSLYRNSAKLCGLFALVVVLMYTDL